MITHLWEGIGIDCTHHPSDAAERVSCWFKVSFELHTTVINADYFRHQIFPLENRATPPFQSTGACAGFTKTSK